MGASTTFSSASWPTAANFSTVLQNPRVAFRDKELQQVEIEWDPQTRQPKVRPGSYANVYRATHPNGLRQAIRVFTSACAERRERYQAIGDYLQSRRLACLVSFTYTENGIRSAGDGKFYPLVTMDWIDGENLQDWVRAQCLQKNQKSLARVTELWVEAVRELAAARIAHGDLQQGNVMISVRNEVKLVDYDCMCVPALEGRKNLEIGLDPYQHPDRNGETRLNKELDNFSAIVIHVALKALAASPDLWTPFVEKKAYDKLLFQHDDLHAPGQSQLIQALMRSPDRDVPRLCQGLLDLVHADIGQVPRLEEFLVPLERIEALLSQRDFDGALELVNRTKKPLSTFPAALQPKLRNAHQRVECRLELDKAIQQGLEAEIQRCYKKALLDDYPKAKPLVAIARTSPQVVPVLQQLDDAKSAKAWDELVRLWDDNRDLLKDRKSAERFQKDVSDSQRRNDLCGTVLALLQQPDGNLDPLVPAWQQLVALGGHRKTDPKRSEIENLVKRQRAWETFEKAGTALSEEADRQLVPAWNEALFAGWKRAEAQRPRVNEARKRLELLARLDAEIGKVRSLLDEQQVQRLAIPLPKDYAYAARPRVQQAQHRLKAGLALQDALREPASDQAIAAAAKKLDEYQGRCLLPADALARVRLAEERLPCLTAIKKIPADYSAGDAPQQDPKLLAAWKDSLLADCHDAQPWKAAYQRAAQRREILDKLRNAVNAGDNSVVAKLAGHACLKGYPLPPSWASAVQQALAEAQAIRKLSDVLEQGQRSRFREVFDAAVIRQNPSAFQAHRELLRQWIPEEILPPGKLGLCPPVGREGIVPQSGAACGPAYRVCWSWPHPRFSQQCLLVVSGSLPTPGEDPRHLRAALRLSLDRKRYEEGGGGVMIDGSEECRGGYVTVWVRIDVGFEKFMSGPLILGQLDGPPSATGRGRRRESPL
jgi:hypothetical protein